MQGPNVDIPHRDVDVKNDKVAPRRTPTRLHFLHPFLVTRILAFLSKAERIDYLKVDHRLTSDEKEGKKPKGTKQERLGRHSSATKMQPHRIDQWNDETITEDEPTFVPVAIADPFTLLARLNTRRLRGRLVYFRKTEQSREPYSKNKTTNEIAAEEWERLLNDAKEQGESNSIPSPYELLLFSPCPRPVTILASYPRSGNSLMRNLFERTTLRVTGSDMRGGLTQHDLVGEAAVSANIVQFVKTHFPERRGEVAFRSSRAVLLIRNPYDAIESYFNLMMTNTHTTSISEEQRNQYKNLWQEHVLKEIQVWRAFHEYWLQQEIPLLLVKYEDLIRFPDKVMARVIQ
jgi:hypothetical protein